MEITPIWEFFIKKINLKIIHLPNIEIEPKGSSKELYLLSLAHFHLNKPLSSAKLCASPFWYSNRPWTCPNLIYKVACCVHLSVCMWPLDAEKSDSVHREKWREKDKTTVGGRAFGILYLRPVEVLKPRSWEPNAVTRQQQKKRVVAPKIRFSG
jgi:hypothetical protein